MADTSTAPVRIYRGDIPLLRRAAAAASAERDRRVTIGEIVHEHLADLRAAEDAKGERG
jgi:hypothetical protein